jgi:pyruvate dehydrogenase E2 component (dihydrolipoamide acetyltransferase)
VPHDGMRKTIAARLTESKQTIPPSTCRWTASWMRCLKLRGELNKAAPERRQACLQAVGQRLHHQGAGAGAARRAGRQCVLDVDRNMVKHKHADVGVAVSIPGGLITPIVRRAEEKPLSAISAR